MADLFSQKKHHQIHHPLKKLTPILILFFVSFFLILLILLGTQSNLHLFLSPSLYRDLFSQSHTTTPSPLSSQSLVSPIISTESKVSISPNQAPVSDGVFDDSGFDGKKAENGSTIVPISKGVPTRSELDENGARDAPISQGVTAGLKFDGEMVENGSTIVPISKGVPTDSDFDGQKAEIGARIAPISQGVTTDLKFDGEKGGSGSTIVPISVGVPTDLDFDGEKAGNGARIDPISQDSEFNGENGARIESSQMRASPGFVNGSGTGVGGTLEEELGRREKGCNLYMGKWVRDDGYPVYKPGSCPYVDEAFDCQSNGRPDSGYLNWRWKPDDCDLPRFNATDFLVRLRGKRLMLVGDSMNRNQFESMLCLLREGLPDKSKMYEVHGYKITKGRGFYIFKFVDFNCTVEFVRSHFLVKEGTRINGQGNSNPTLSIDKIDKSAGKWKQADILIFNTAHWWTHGKTSRGKNYFKEGDHVYPRFDAVEAYRRALKTWAEWIDKNVNPARQMVFYRAYSSAHFRGGDWDSGGTCNGETEPILGGAFLDNYPLKMKIVEEAIQQMRVPVILLNVTRLTNFRKDGHPSIYGKVRRSGMKVSTRRQDCSHWCLPGVPDAWNELIYATLVFQ